MNIFVVENLNETQIEKLHRLYQNEWFTKGRKLEDIKVMLNNTSFVFGFCDSKSEELVGFARVISDFIYKAFIFDVIVDPDFRNKGMGKFIMNTLFEHPVLKQVCHIELYCPEDNIAYYEPMGFHVRKSLLLRREKTR